LRNERGVNWELKFDRNRSASHVQSPHTGRSCVMLYIAIV